MLGEPNARELLAAVKSYLEQVAIPALSGHAAFHGRVAANVVAILERELADGPRAAQAEAARLHTLLHAGENADLISLRAQLCAEIEAGQMDAATPGLLDHLLQTAADRLAIEQPNYASLKRVEN
jgi:hypothetical protein